MNLSNTANEEWAVNSNAEGIDRVENMDGKYAFLMESKAIQYMIERNCKLHQVGGNLDNKGYGIPMKPDSPYKPLIDGKLVELQEGGVFHRLTVKWWKQKRGGGACVGSEAAGGVAELGMPNVVGVFVFTVGACLVAVLHAIYEFFKGAKEQAEELGTSWGHEIKYAMIFALQCHGNTKVCKRPLPKLIK